MCCLKEKWDFWLKRPMPVPWALNRIGSKQPLARTRIHSSAHPIFISLTLSGRTVSFSLLIWRSSFSSNPSSFCLCALWNKTILNEQRRFHYLYHPNLPTTSAMLKSLATQIVYNLLPGIQLMKIMRGVRSS